MLATAGNSILYQNSATEIGLAHFFRPLVSQGDDRQLLVWDLSSTSVSPRQQVRSPALPESSQSATRTITDPAFAYLAPSEVNNLTWSPPMTSLALGGGLQTAPGEWIAIATGKTVKVLKV